MIKSLYVRVVLTFMGAVILSIVVASLLINRLYLGEIKEAVQENMISTGKIIIEAYQKANDENVNALMKGITSLPQYSVRLYNREGKLLYVSGNPPAKQAAKDAAHLQAVLNGGVYRGERDGQEANLTVGLPFTADGSQLALFITPEINALLTMIAGFFKSQLLFILVLGSILILIAARYIVQPLQRLTRATRRMARGDFKVSLQTKRKDEIGQLTQSFNVMARDLGELEAVRKQFVSDVSHEIQSPLTSIQGFTQALKHKQLDEESRMRLLDIIEEESNRLSRLCGDLLQLSALEYEHLELEPVAFALDEQLRKAVIALEPQWSAKGLNMELELERTTVVADEDKMYQIWRNLLSNSIKFTGEGGTVQITAVVSGNEALVTVADNGVGMPEGELLHIFKPFYKLDKARERKLGGNGIGLSIVKRIADLHHARIEIASTQGGGTTISVTLPLVYSKPEL